MFEILPPLALLGTHYVVVVLLSSRHVDSGVFKLRWGSISTRFG